MQRAHNTLTRSNHNLICYKSSGFGNSNCSLLQNCKRQQKAQQCFRHKSDKSRAVSRTIQAQREQKDILFGLRPVDFSIVPPLYKQPPPPPPPPGFRKYVLHISLAIFTGTFGYFYVNNQNDSYEYWETMQTGGVLPGTYDDDDDDEEDEEEE